MILKEGKISIFIGQDSTVIEIIDASSSMTFVTVTLTPEQLSMALSRLSHTPCKIETRGLEKIGKTLEVSNLQFEITDTNYNTRRQSAYKTALDLCTDGWIPDNYFESQSSFFTKEGNNYAQCTVRRWV